MGDSTHRVLLLVALGLLAAFLLFAVAGITALLAIRGVRQATSERRRRNGAATRALIVAAMVEEGEAAVAADQDLLALRGRAWAHAEAAMLKMLAKVRGDAQARLVALLKARGTEHRALKQTRSRRAFVRCRGAFALGVLRSGGAVDRLIVLTEDPAVLVRRLTARSLGLIGDARAVEPLLSLANRDLGLTRDLIFALREIGLKGAPELRAAVNAGIERPNRSGPIAASVLGIIQDVGASMVLADALLRGPTALRLAAAHSLGHLDSRQGVPPLQAALESSSNQVRVAAAASLGRLGADVAIPALVDALGSPDPATARAAADALVSTGPAGRVALERSRNRYAIEAVALDLLRRRA